MANSFKQMTKAGVIKRTDTGMFIALSDITFVKVSTSVKTMNATARLMMTCSTT
jgi:hypothetical protein